MGKSKHDNIIYVSCLYTTYQRIRVVKSEVSKQKYSSSKEVSRIIYNFDGVNNIKDNII